MKEESKIKKTTQEKKERRNYQSNNRRKYERRIIGREVSAGDPKGPYILGIQQTPQVSLSVS